MTVQETVTQEAVEAYAFSVMGFATGQYVSLMIHLGDRLGLYKILAKNGAVTADSLAEQTGLKRRWLLEWLRNQAAAGLIEYLGGDHFRLSKAAVPVLIDETNPFNLTGLFHHPFSVEELGRIAEAFETGLGVSYNAQGVACACTVKRICSPAHSTLVYFLQRVDGLHERLEAGASVVDVGCGSGVALRELARHYPNSTFEGYDPAVAAIELALADTKAEGLTNISYHIARGEDLPQQPQYDLVLTLDCIHDMPFPQDVMDAIRAAVKPDGVWVIKDIRCSDKIEENLANPMASLFYGISVMLCMSSALSEPGGAGLGTLGFNPVLAQQMTQASGFSRFKQLPIEEDPFNNFYEVRV